MTQRSEGVSKLYEAGGAVRQIRRPAQDDVIRKPTKAQRRARREREERQTLNRAHRYLEATLIERSHIDQLIAAGRTHDSKGRQLDFLLSNLTNREKGLRAAIARLTGLTDTESAPLRDRGIDTSEAAGVSPTATQGDPPLQADPNASDDIGGNLGVPLPTERQRLEGLIYRTRDGQDLFREQILAVYSGCALTGCQDFAALEAAHIIPYVNAESHKLRNGLCLRADIHLLFDRGLISFDLEYRAVVGPQLTWPEYRNLHNRILTLPQDPALWPDRRLLSIRHKYI